MVSSAGVFDLGHAYSPLSQNSQIPACLVLTSLDSVLSLYSTPRALDVLGKQLHHWFLPHSQWTPGTLYSVSLPSGSPS